MKTNNGYLFENIVLGFIPWLVLYLLVGGESLWWVFLLGGITAGILVFNSATELREDKYHLYSFFGKLEMVDSGLFFKRFGGWGGKIFPLPKGAFNAKTRTTIDFADLKSIEKFLKGNVFAKLAKYHFPMDILVTLQIDKENPKKFFINTNGGVISPSADWMKHVLEDIKTSLVLIGLINGFWYLKVHGDWKISEIDSEVNRAIEKLKELRLVKSGVDSLNDTLGLYAVKLKNLNTTVDLPTEMRDANMREYLVLAQKEARLIDAEIKAKEAKIAAEAEAKAIRIKAEAEAEAKKMLILAEGEADAKKQSFITNEFVKSMKKLKGEDLTPQEASDAAKLIHDLYDKEHLFRVEGLGVNGKGAEILTLAMTKLLEYFEKKKS